MPIPFFSNIVRYHETPVISEISFPESFQAVSTVSKALHDQFTMELLFEKQEIKSRFSSQRAKVVEVTRALSQACECNLEIMNIGHETGCVRPDFEMIYLAEEELISSDFNSVTTDELNQLKQVLIANLLQFEFYVLGNKKNEFYQYLEAAGKLKHCRQIIMCIQQLIASAKSVSGVIASIVTGADVLAQTNLLGNETIAGVFNIELPGILETEIQKMNLGKELNPAGSAFQLEQACQSLIMKLETYLNKRASLDSQFEAGGIVSKQYNSIDRGFFYNRALQQGRIVIAANLLAQLQYRHREDGVAITKPQVLAQLLMDAIDANEQCYEQHAKCTDGAGELAKFLESMRKEMGKIYTQPVQYEEGEEVMNLRVKLKLESPACPQFKAL